MKENNIIINGWIQVDQVVEGDALLSTAHVLVEAIIGDQQQRTCVLPVIMSLPLLSVVTCDYDTATAN